MSFSSPQKSLSLDYVGWQFGDWGTGERMRKGNFSSYFPLSSLIRPFSFLPLLFMPLVIGYNSCCDEDEYLANECFICKDYSLTLPFPGVQLVGTQRGKQRAKKKFKKRAALFNFFVRCFLALRHIHTNQKAFIFLRAETSNITVHPNCLFYYKNINNKMR